MVGRELSDTLGSFMVITTNRAELRVIENINQTISDPRKHIIPVTTYEKARAELRSQGHLMNVIAIEADQSLMALLERVADKVTTWSHQVIDGFLSGMERLISKFQAALRLAYSA